MKTKEGPPVVYFGEFKMGGLKSAPMGLAKAMLLKNLYNEFGLELVVYIVYPGVA